MQFKTYDLVRSTMLRQFDRVQEFKNYALILCNALLFQAGRKRFSCAKISRRSTDRSSHVEVYILENRKISHTNDKREFKIHQPNHTGNTSYPHNSLFYKLTSLIS